MTFSRPLAQIPGLPMPEQEPATAPSSEDAQLAATTQESTSTESFIDQLHIDKTLSETEWSGWGILLLGIFGGVVAGRLMQHSLRSIARVWISRDWKLRGTTVLSAAGPASLALLTLGLAAGLIKVEMSDELQKFVAKGLAFLYIITIAWFTYNLVDLIDVALRHVTSKTESKLDDQLVPLIRKTLRIFLVVVFVLFIAENVFGADITAWLAGLGLAGLAVSLAAQDSIKNLFGSIAIFLDRPFSVGDRIIFDGHDGPVEEIGFRSTKIRTGMGEVVTVPNSKIVDASVKNVGMRPNVLRKLNVALTYDTPPAKIERAIQLIKNILKEPEMAEPFHDMDKYPPRVHFSDLTPDSLNIQVLYWFYPPTDNWKYMEHAQNFNFKLLRAFEAEGIEFAFPTHTIHMAGGEKPGQSK